MINGLFPRIKLILFSYGFSRFVLILFQVKLVINNWFKDNNMLVSLCSFVSIALIIGRQTLEYLFVLIVCQNSTSTVRPLCACHALSSQENYSIIEETQLWKVNGHLRIFFFCHECMVRVLMRSSFAGSFSLIFHLSNAKKKTSRKFSLSQWWHFKQAKSCKFTIVVNEKWRVQTW